MKDLIPNRDFKKRDDNLEISRSSSLKTFTDLLKFLLLLGLFLQPILVSAQIFDEEQINMPGSWNETDPGTWDNPPTNEAIANSLQKTDGRIELITTGVRRYQTIFSVAANGADFTGGTYEWLFTSGPTNNIYANKWGGVNVTTNTLQDYTFGGTNNSVTLTNDNWYTMNFRDNGYENTQAIFMETSAEPVSINSVTRDAEHVAAGKAVEITIELSSAPSAEEKFYVRYTTDGFTSSSLVEFSVVGSTGTATIPGESAGTTVTYYVLSTTISNPTDDYDMMTLKKANNNGNNYSYTTREIGFANLQSPGILTLPTQDDSQIYARLYIDGVTTHTEESAEINAWIGFNADDTNPEEWLEEVWQEADFSSGAVGLNGNDHEYKIDADTLDLPTGKYYYASRFQFGNGDFVYGGYSGDGTGGDGSSPAGIWDGVDNNSGELNVTGPQTVIAPATVVKNQAFNILLEDVYSVSSGFLNDSYSITVQTRNTDAAPEDPWNSAIFDGTVAFSTGYADFNVTLPEAGDFDLLVTINVPSKNEVLEFEINDVRSEGFTATTGQVQHPTIPFMVSIANATDNDTPPADLQGSYEVIVRSIDGPGFVGDGQIFQGSVDFNNGSALVPVVINSEGAHRLEVELDVEGTAELATVTPDIFVIDFSGFNIVAPSPDPVSGLQFDLTLNNAIGVNGVQLSGEKEVVITSNQMTEEVFRGDVMFSGGEGSLPVILDNPDIATTTTHNIVVTVEGVFSSKTRVISVEGNSGDFDIVIDPDGLLSPANTIEAGDPFYVQIENALDIDGSTPLPAGDYTVRVSSDQHPDDESLVIENVAFSLDGSNSSATFIVNPTGNKTITKDAGHILTLRIDEIGKSNESALLTVNPGPPSNIIITQQPNPLNEGSFDGSATFIGVVVAQIADEFGNYSGFDGGGPPVGAELIKPLDSDAELTGIGSNIIGAPTNGFDGNGQATFPDLKVDSSNGTYRLRITSTTWAGGTLNDVETNDFEMVNMEDISAFEIVDPGPQVQDTEFTITLANVSLKDGSLLTGDRLVSVTQEDSQENVITVVDQISYTFSEGEGELTLTAPTPASFISPFNDYTYTITIFNINDETGGGTDLEDSIVLTIEEDASAAGFTLALDASLDFADDVYTAIAGDPFDVLITNAFDISGEALNGNHRVTISTVSEGVLLDEDVAFTNGSPDVAPQVSLQETLAGQLLTVAIEWIPVEESVTVDVIAGFDLTVNDEIIDETDNPVDFGSRIVGYSAVSPQTVTVTRVGTGDITGLTVGLSGANSDSFTTDPAEILGDLSGTTTSLTFTIQPNTGLSVGSYEAIVSVGYDGVSKDFKVLFEVEDSYAISLELIENEIPQALPEPFIFEPAQSGYAEIAKDTIQINNTGTGEITGLNVFLTGANPGSFIIVDSPGSSILFDQSASFTLRPETGLSEGTYNAVVNVEANNDILEQFSVTFTVTSTGLSISISPSPDDLFFLGTMGVGYDDEAAGSVSQTFTVTNTGDEDLTAATEVALITGDTESFRISGINSVSWPVTPGNSFQFTVQPEVNGSLIAGEYQQVLLTVAPNGDVNSATPIDVGFLVDDIEWTGDFDSQWSLKENWKPATYTGTSPSVDEVRSLPSRFVDIVIPPTTNNPVISGQNRRTRSLAIQGGSAVGASLTVVGNGILTVDAGGTLTIQDDATAGGHLIINSSLVNNGTLTLESAETAGGQLTVGPLGKINSAGTINSASAENFVVQSNSIGTGNVLLSNNGVAATVERWMKPNVHLHLLSAPVEGQNINDLLTSYGTIGSDINISVHDETTHTWTNWGEDIPTGNFETGRSYVLVTNGEGTLEFKGTLTQGTKSVSATNNKFGWNAMGNPYSASFNVTDFLNANWNELRTGFKAVYVYDYTKPVASRYVPITLQEGQRNLINGQGFFVRVGDVNGEAGTHNLTFNNSMRRDAQSGYFKDGGTDEGPQEEWHRMVVYMEKPENKAQTVITFNENMTEGVDDGYDAGLLGFDDSFVLFTRAPGSNVNFGVRALPASNYENMTIPLGVLHAEEGPVTFSADISGLPYYLAPLLYDAHTGIYHELVSPGITLDLSQSSPANRFFIRMADHRNTHAVTFSPLTTGGDIIAEAGQELIGSGDAVAEGSKVSFTALPWSGYNVDYWTINAEILEGNDNDVMVINHLLENTDVRAAFLPSEKFDTPLDAGQVAPEEGLHIFTSEQNIIIKGHLEENSTAVLYDVTGKAVLEKKLAEGYHHSVELHGLEEGIYIIHVIDKEKVESRRLYVR